MIAFASAAPSMFATHGPAGDPVAALGITLTTVGAVVTGVVTLLLLWAMFHPRHGQSGDVQRGNAPGAIRWIVIGGILVPSLILVASFAYSMGVQARVAAPPTAPAVTVEVLGHRWWWEIRYRGSPPSEGFTTANELHVPVGRPVRIRLASADVIHSFWVPQLAGKTDVVPGQNNEMWLQADRPGTYLGKCAEYCGLEHAQMYFSVVAETPERYAAWVANQQRPAVSDQLTSVPTGYVRPTPPGTDPSVPAPLPAATLRDVALQDPAAVRMQVARGQQVFLARQCAACHAVRGTNALGRVGPDLTHLASRRTIAAGVLPNTRGNLGGWVSNAQAIKPGNLMPTIPLSGPDLQALLAYLETLR
ncbi:cytochrome c oxidase polypeptide II [Gemmatimonadetes bacterium T265]|nr:cytochrome c oxidase polypeptide II [Gemmatimonadetes bacterium T265]